MFAKDKCHLHLTLNKPHCICLRLVSHAPKILRAIVCGVLSLGGKVRVCRVLLKVEPLFYLATMCMSCPVYGMGPVFYLTTSGFHYPPRFRRSCAQSDEWATLIRQESRQEVTPNCCQIK